MAEGKIVSAVLALNLGSFDGTLTLPFQSVVDVNHNNQEELADKWTQKKHSEQTQNPLFSETDFNLHQSECSSGPVHVTQVGFKCFPFFASIVISAQSSIRRPKEDSLSEEKT